MLRNVLKGYVYERFLGLTAAEGLDAESLFSYIRNANTEHGLSSSVWDSVMVQQSSVGDVLESRQR